MPVVPDERLQAEHEHQVDEQLLHEQVAGRPAGRRVDEGAGDEGGEQHGARPRVPAHASGSAPHTRSALRTVNSPCGRTTNRAAMRTNTTASVSRSHTPSGR